MITNPPERPRRWVEMSFTFTGPVSVFADSTPDDLEFLYNESSSCADNILDILKGWQEESGCLCQYQEAEFIKELPHLNDPNIQS